MSRNIPRVNPINAPSIYVESIYVEMSDEPTNAGDRKQQRAMDPTARYAADFLTA
jgi:hypothetical protein